MMIATWPMVIAAGAGGLLLGVLASAPAPQRPAETAATSEPAMPAPQPKRQTTESSEAANGEKPETPCAHQAWPYFDHSCLDRTAPAEQNVRVVAVPRIDPAEALRAMPQEPQTAGQPNAAARHARRELPESAGDGGSKQRVDRTPSNESPPSADVDRSRREAAKPDARRQRSVPEPSRSARADAWRERQEYFDREFRKGPARVYIRRDGSRIYVYPERRYPLRPPPAFIPG